MCKYLTISVLNLSTLHLRFYLCVHNSLRIREKWLINLNLQVPKFYSKMSTFMDRRQL